MRSPSFYDATRTSMLLQKSSPAAALLALSGGLDSTVLCAMLLADYGAKSVAPVFFRYGSKHNPWEEQAATAIAAHYGLELAVIDMTATFSNVSSALLASDSRPIPKTGYTATSLAQTIVPGRNLLFAAAMAAMAESLSIPRIVLGTHGGDHPLYPDCRPEFNAALANVVACGTDGKVSVVAPLAVLNKADIVTKGLLLNAPLHLTRSCYESQDLSCGKCATCRERLEAFAAGGVCDPIAYA